MPASVMTRKGQVTIPKEIRTRLGLKQGTKVLFFLRENEVALKPLRGTILDLKGSVTPSARPEDLEGVRRAVKRSVASRIRKDG